jgi:KUP system potassium uptake protein
MLDGNRQNDISFETYSDASHGSASEELKSVAGYCVMMAGAAISTRSARLDHITLSTCESELSALSEAVRETIWMRDLLKELTFPQMNPTTIYCDNQSTIHVVLNPIRHPATKHITIRYLYAREQQENNLIRVKYCPTEMMIADIFTKALPSKQFCNLRNLLGIIELKPHES